MRMGWLAGGRGVENWGEEGTEPEPCQIVN